MIKFKVQQVGWDQDKLCRSKCLKHNLIELTHLKFRFLAKSIGNHYNKKVLPVKMTKMIGTGFFSNCHEGSLKLIKSVVSKETRQINLINRFDCQLKYIYGIGRWNLTRPTSADNWGDCKKGVSWSKRKTKDRPMLKPRALSAEPIAHCSEMKKSAILESSSENSNHIL